MSDFRANARYADGLAAVTHDADVHFGGESVLFRIAAGATAWPYAQIRRVDDDNGKIILRQEPDTGERLIFDEQLGHALRAAAPVLFTDHARGRESWKLLTGLTVAAAALAAVFLVGVPLAAKPLAQVLPAGYTQRIGAIAEAQVDAASQRCNGAGDAAGQGALTRVAQRLAATARPATRDHLTITMVSAPPGSILAQPNAFALPDGAIVITKPMIGLIESPEELAGVMAHEIGHIDERHVMANVIRNIGVGVFFDVVFGGAGAGQAVALASVNLASLGYSRGDESDADRRGYDFMEAAGYNPGASSGLFSRLAAMERQSGAAPIFLQSHPASGARAEAARARSHAAREIAFTPAEWTAVQAMCSGAGAASQASPMQSSGGGPAPLPPGGSTQPSYPGANIGQGGGPAPLPPSSGGIPAGGPGKSAGHGAAGPGK